MTWDCFRLLALLGSPGARPPCRRFMRHSLSVGLLAGFIGLACSLGYAQGTGLLTNGNFETGNFNGWTVANVASPSGTIGSRNFYTDAPGTTTPTANGFTGHNRHGQAVQS